MQQRGRVTAIVAMLVALPVAAAALWKPVREEWYLYQLRSPDAPTRSLAAQRLGEMQCFRAIVPIREMLEDEGALKSASLVDPSSIESLWISLRELQRPGAVPYLVGATKHENSHIREWAVQILGSLER